MTECWHLLELTWHFICFCYNYNVKNYNDNNSSYRSQQTGCWIQPVGGISKDRGGIHGGGELWWSSLLCCSWPRVLSERCVCVSESWREGSMNKADSVNYSEKCFWMPWGKKRAGGEFIYVCVCMCDGHWSHWLGLRSHLNQKFTDAISRGPRELTQTCCSKSWGWKLQS